MILIAFGHSARVGKDESARILVDNHGFTRVAFADALKDFVYATDAYVAEMVRDYGWEEAKEKDPTVRKTLVGVGNAARELLDPDIWITAAFRRLAEHTCISDVRYLNEARSIKKVGGCLVKITRPGFPPLENIADQALVDYDEWDAEILNDGSIKELEIQLDTLVQKITPVKGTK